jgi:hypothetical protein
MTLTPNEAREAYAGLSNIAKTAGLTWLVEDVAVEISLGKQSLQKLTTETTQAQGEEYAPKRKGKPAMFVITADYTESEKLGLLVDAIAAVSFGSTIALTQVFDHLAHGTQQSPAEITFAPDGETGQCFTVDKSVFRQKNDAMSLQGLLRELKETI